MSKYSLAPLTELCDVLSGGTPRTNISRYWSGEVPWASVKDFNINARWFSNTEKRISREGFDSCSSVLLEPGELIISARGTVGVVAQTKIQTAFNQSNYGLRAKQGIADNDYLYYALVNANQTLLRDTHGGMFDTITRSTLDRLLIPNPPLEEQKRIAKALGVFDEKIALNIQQSQTLGQLAQAIFKSWFVNFEPVFAKMAGDNPVGMNESVAALFPDTFDDSEFGPIPKGWFWGSLGDIADVIDCLHSKKPELLSDGFPYLQLDTISNEGVLFFDKAAFISEEDYRRWTSRIEVTGGDCLITNVGRVGAISQVPDSFKAAIGRNITALRPKSLPLYKSFLIISLLSDFMKKEITKNTDSGTILEALNVKNIPKLRIPRPNDALLTEFARICDPIQAQIQTLYSMNIKLRSIRDSLLPRLVSGELKIPAITVAK
jgi:type I restriction enzyme S subunit